MEPSLGRFSLFLLSLVLMCCISAVPFLFTGLGFLKRKALRPIDITIPTCVSIAVYFFFISIIFWILTGEHYILIFLLLACVSILGMLIVELLWLIFGVPNIPWVGRLAWAKYEFEKTMTIGHKIIKIGAILVVVFYPIYIGVGYFGEIISHGDWAKYVFRATLLYFMGFSMVIALPQQWWTIMSQNILEATRARMFIGQLGASVSVLMYMSLFLWASGYSGQTFDIIGEYFVFSPVLVVFMVIYILLILVVPYLIGHFRSKEWMEKLESEISDVRKVIKRVLSSPDFSKLDERLDECERVLEGKLEKLDETPVMRIALQLETTSDGFSAAPRWGFQESKGRDPRFIYKQKLVDLLNQLREYKQEFNKGHEIRTQRELLKSYIETLEKAEQSTAGASKPWVLVGLTAIAGAILNPILSSVSKLVIKEIGLE